MMNTPIRIILIVSLVLDLVISILYKKPACNTVHMIGLVVFLAIWIFVLVDLTKNRIYNKQFWVLSLIVLMPLATFLYLIQREKLIRLGTKFGTKGYYRSNFNKNGQN